MKCASQHEKTCNTSGPMTLQGQRKGRHRPLNWILGVLPRHLKIPLPRPSFQPLKQTKEADSDFHCPLVRCPFSDFRPEPWEQNKEWRLEKLPANNELRWTMKSLNLLILIEHIVIKTKYWKSWQHRGKMRISHPSQVTNSWACHENLPIENTFRYHWNHWNQSSSQALMEVHPNSGFSTRLYLHPWRS